MPGSTLAPGSGAGVAGGAGVPGCAPGSPLPPLLSAAYSAASARAALLWSAALRLPDASRSLIALTWLRRKIRYDFSPAAVSRSMLGLLTASTIFF